MREILFRAKRKDTGEWATGYYVYNYRHDSNMILFNCNGCMNAGFRSRREDFYLQDCEVDPETVCQYTGLTDKNGRKIFEGDIVQYCDCTVENYVIEWDLNKALFEYRQYSCSIMNFDELSGIEVEVIGNIFDNPELWGCGGKGKYEEINDK